MNNSEKNKNLDVLDTTKLKSDDLPLISIITVTRNLILQDRESSFRSAIHCVQRQSFRNIEHIVMDGASDDGTQNMIREIINKYKKNDNYVQIRYRSEKDRGLYDAMNKAVNIARGKYILFLNSDDSLASFDVLAKIAALIKPLLPDFAYGTHIVLGEDGEKREMPNTNLAAFLQRMPFHHNSMVVQKTIFKKLDGHNLKYKVSADYDFVFRMLSNGFIGMDMQFPISVFKTGGISSNVVAVANDHAVFWKHFFSKLDAQSTWSHSDYVKWYQIGQIPLRACWFAFKKGKKIPLLRKAALHSAQITLRRKFQPWRTWDNLR